MKNNAEAVAPSVSTAPPNKDTITRLYRSLETYHADATSQGRCPAGASCECRWHRAERILREVHGEPPLIEAQPIESTGTDTPTKVPKFEELTELRSRYTGSTNILIIAELAELLLLWQRFCLKRSDYEAVLQEAYEAGRAAPLRPSAPTETTETDLSKAAALEIWRVPQHYASWLESTAEIVRRVAQSSREALLREIAQDDPLWPLYQEYMSKVPPKGTKQMTFQEWKQRLADNLRAEAAIPKQAAR
jgi:hypothetical protein